MTVCRTYGENPDIFYRAQKNNNSHFYELSISRNFCLKIPQSAEHRLEMTEIAANCVNTCFCSSTEDVCSLFFL